MRLLQDPERKKEVVGLLGDVSDERFADLVELGKRMTDFTTEPTAEDATAGDMLDDGIGVAVEFEGEDEDDEDENVDEIAVSCRSLKLRHRSDPMHVPPAIDNHTCAREVKARSCHECAA